VVAHALSAIDQAIWDAAARAQDQPLWATLSRSETPPSLPAVYGTVWAPETMPEVALVASQAKEAGLIGVKVAYAAGLPSLDSEAVTLRALRQALDPEQCIMVDWQTGGTVEDLRQRHDLYTEVGLRWLEEPFDREAFASYEIAAKFSAIDLAAGESETRLAGFERFADAGVRVLQPDLGRCGGLSAASEVAALASRLSLLTVPHSWSTPIIDEVNLHWVIASGLELVETPMHADRLARGIARQLDPSTRRIANAPTAVGHGVELDLRTFELAK
jgi:L-alanine-DL-glutamate epimerase-like enolase superfamily enzyme